MADQDDKPDDKGADLDLDKDEADKLLEDDGNDSGDNGNEPEKGADSDNLQAEIDKWKSLSRKNEKAFREASTKLKKYEDEGKSDKQRLEESAAEHRTRADKAEATAKALQVAMDRAPEHATLAQVRAVAKRVRGDDDEALQADADELFELLSAGPKAGDRVAGSRPKERLKGGAAPDEETEEMDPAKLAALTPRRT